MGIDDLLDDSGEEFDGRVEDVVAPDEDDDDKMDQAKAKIKDLIGDVKGRIHKAME